MTQDLLTGLNERQRAAVTAGEGPVLVLAGPGSGKTRVLTHRVAYLIEAMGVHPRNLVAVTFTNKAANEMRMRVEALIGRRAGLRIGTFHSICAQILRIESDVLPYNEDYVIFDTDDQLTALKQAMAEVRVDVKKFSPRRVLGAISSAKNEMILPGDFFAEDYFGEIVARVYPRYQSVLLDNNAMDFDDLLLQMALLLRNNQAVREKYQNRFDFVLVDEFQDTNMVQYDLVKRLGEPRQNVFVVGDEDQSIYAFRGADYRNVLRFREDFGQAQTILLEQNYRSTQMVLDVARAVINKNANRTPKALFTDRGSGVKVTVHEAYNETQEAEYIIERIDELCRRQGYNYGDFAVMYRTNAQSRALEATCVNQGTPYVLVGAVGFYKRREIKDLLAYLRVVNNPSDKVSFARIINVPKRGIGNKSLQDFQRWAAHEDISYDEALGRLMEGEVSPLSSRAKRLFADFGLMLREWQAIAQEGDLLHLFDTIVSQTAYRFYLSEISDTDMQTTERNDNVQELRGLLQAAQEEEQPLSEFLIEQALVSDVDNLTPDTEAVTLLTLHSAKGLEFPVVFLTGLEDGLLPHSRSFDDLDGLSEERRLMYVGITRAKDLLYLTYAFRRRLYGDSTPNNPSRFLADIPRELVDGLPPGLLGMRDRQTFQQETRWDPLSRLQRDLRESRPSGKGNAEIRGKILPFPGSKPLTYKTGLRVRHALFGEGIVIESERVDGREEVTVAFEDKQYGIKRLDVEIAKLKILDG